MKLLAAERQKFLNEEWPRVYDTIHRLGLNPQELLEPSMADKAGRNDEEREEESLGD